MSQLFFYDQKAGEGELYSLSDGLLAHPVVHKGWRKNWHKIVQVHGGIVFYDREKNELEFYKLSGTNMHSGVNTKLDRSFNKVVAIPKHRILVLYDKKAGFGQAMAYDESGHFKTIKTFSDWRKSWSLLIPVQLETTHSPGILFYDRSKGEGEIWTFDSKGEIKHVKTHPGWKNTWTRIQSLMINGKQFLLFYEKSQGLGEMYELDNKGNIHHKNTHQGWRKVWKHISTNPRSDLVVFYDNTTGEGHVYRFFEDGNMKHLHEYTNWRKTWHTINLLQ